VVEQAGTRKVGFPGSAPAHQAHAFGDDVLRDAPRWLPPHRGRCQLIAMTRAAAYYPKFISPGRSPEQAPIIHNPTRTPVSRTCPFMRLPSPTTGWRSSRYTLSRQSEWIATNRHPGDDGQLSLIARVLFHGMNFNPKPITQRPKNVTMMVPSSSRR
jgi:hypothetical protein